MPKTIPRGMAEPRPRPWHCTASVSLSAEGEDVELRVPPPLLGPEQGSQHGKGGRREEGPKGGWPPLERATPRVCLVAKGNQT